MSQYIATTSVVLFSKPLQSLVVLIKPKRWCAFGSWLMVGALSFVLLSIWMRVTPASAQSYCGERSAITKSLGIRYQEKLVANGLADGGAVIEIFASSKGSWTMLLTTPTGRTCYMASGEGWESMPKLAKGTKI